MWFYLAPHQNTFTIMKALLLSIALLMSTAPLWSQEDESFLQLGDPAPSFELYAPNGDTLNSAKVLASGQSLVLVFYRGTWCPYCNRYLSELAKAEKEIEAAGGMIVAISGEIDTMQTVMQKQTKAKYFFAHDRSYRVMDMFGVGYEVNEKQVEKMAKKGNDLHALHQSEEFVLLPVPATVVIAPSGEITYLHYDRDYKQRGNVDDILHALSFSSNQE